MYGLINKMQIIAAFPILILLQSLFCICLWERKKATIILFVVSSHSPHLPTPKITIRVWKMSITQATYLDHSHTLEEEKKSQKKNKVLVQRFYNFKTRQVIFSLSKRMLFLVVVVLVRRIGLINLEKLPKSTRYI